MEQSESALVRAAARGDEGAFAALLRRHRDRVYRVARRIVGSHEAAEDIAQRVFITMHQKLHTFRGDSQLSTWLYRVTINACYDHLRRERPPVHFDLDRLPTLTIDPVRRVANTEALARVNAHVMALPDKQRTTLTLRLHEGLSFKEVAAAMGCSVGTAKVNYFHAIRRLRAALQAEGMTAHAL